MDIASLARHVLDSHHTYLHDALPRVDRLMHRPGVITPLREAWSVFVILVEDHIVLEERVIFPAIVDLGEGRRVADFEPSLEGLDRDHRLIEECTRIMHLLTPDTGPLCRMLPQFLFNMDEHSRIESEVLFPQALELLERARRSSDTVFEPAKVAEDIAFVTPPLWPLWDSRQP